mgnify:CR=1 FL=1
MTVVSPNGSDLSMPAAQGTHERIPETPNNCRYCPVASGDRQSKVQSMLGALENPPEGHAVHVVAPLLTAPVPAPISATDPAAHAVHAASAAVF